MTVPCPSFAKRLLLACLGIALAGLDVFFGATWFAGSAVWPPGEGETPRRICTDPATLSDTLARRPPGTPFRIGIVGDIQNGMSEFADLLDEFRAERVDFILQLGDAANVGLPGRYAVLRHLFETHAPGIPVVAVPGNHDIEPDGTTAVWKLWVGPAEWRIDVGGWRIVGIDDANAKISPASMALLKAVAKEPPPPVGTLLVAHRPLAAGLPDKERVDARARQIASTGLVATYTLAGHWHRNARFVDPAGTVHHLLGENSDRSSSGNDPDVSKALLVLGPEVTSEELVLSRLPRRMHFEDEFLRTAVGSVYPALRGHPLLAWSGIAALTFAASVSMFGALSRTVRPAIHARTVPRATSPAARVGGGPATAGPSSLHSLRAPGD